MELHQIEKLLNNRSMLTNIIILVILISMIQFFDSKIIIALGVVVFIILNYDKLKFTGYTGDKIQSEIKAHEISDDMYYNNTIQKLLVQLKRFKKYNKVSYKEGVKYMRKFFKTIHILEKDSLHNYIHYFENASLYLKTFINHFQSITISLPERTYLDGLKHGDYEELKLVNELGSLCKELYKQCYTILLNISLDYNKQWNENPNIFTKEIVFDVNHVVESNINTDNNWTMY